MASPKQEQNPPIKAKGILKHKHTVTGGYNWWQIWGVILIFFPLKPQIEKYYLHTPTFIIGLIDTYVKIILFLLIFIVSVHTKTTYTIYETITKIGL